MASKYNTLFALLGIIQCIHVDAQTDAAPLSFGITERFHSEILGETRTINIYLPENYQTGDSLSWPLIFIPDGGVEEDFFHICGIVRYNTQPWIARFPRSIVVGIENSNRQRDFTFPVSSLDFLEKVGFKKEKFPQYGGSAKYIGFLEKELMPYLAAKYKTGAGKTIIGESLGGLLTTEILLRHTSLFDHYIIISPSLWWGDEVLLKEAQIRSFPKKEPTTSVYIGAPDKKEDINMYRVAKTLHTALKKRGDLTLFFDYLPEEKHSTVIHQAVYNAFRKFYPKTAY